MKLLIIDDDVESCRLLEKRLERYGADIYVADGRTACDMFRAAQQKGAPFDVIFLDIVMPGVDGHEILVRIREWEEQHLGPDDERAKVVMVSAMKDTKNIFASVKEGCDEYMTKPIRRQGVIDVMQKLGYPDPD